ALAVALGREREPLGRLAVPTQHEQGEARASGRVAHARQLLLAGVRVLDVRHACGAVAVALLLAREVLRPVHRASLDSAVMDAFFVDGVRTAFGRAGPKGVFWRTRADDMAVKVVREVLRRNPQLSPERIGDVVFAATAQVGDQGLTMGRNVALLAGIPHTVPGFAV